MSVRAGALAFCLWWGCASLARFKALCGVLARGVYSRIGSALSRALWGVLAWLAWGPRSAYELYGLGWAFCPWALVIYTIVIFGQDGRSRSLGNSWLLYIKVGTPYPIIIRAPVCAVTPPTKV